VIFHTIDLHHVRYGREAALTPSDELTARANNWRRKELSAVESADTTIVVSPIEQSLLEQTCPNSNVALIPLSDVSQPSKIPFEQRRDLLFIGGYAHQPNVDAVAYFVKRVLPLIKQDIPDLKFYVLGNQPTEEVRALAGFDVVVTGKVADLGEYFNKCRVSIAPLLAGAGMKGKVITSLSYGLPCVATPVAEEGIGLTDGLNVLLGSTDQELARAVLLAYKNRELWTKLSTEGLSFIAKHHSPESIRQKIAEVLNDLDLPASESTGTKVDFVRSVGKYEDSVER
jgi:glycosyltransferase involved in cell wall biosynthesis